MCRDGQATVPTVTNHHRETQMSEHHGSDEAGDLPGTPRCRGRRSLNDAIHDLVGAYSLGALGELERARFTKHLTSCRACQTELACFEAISAALDAPEL